MNDLSAGAAQYFTQDHRDCDALWAELEAAIQDRDAAKAGPAWKAFDHAMRRHFSMEEEVLFPAFEQVTGMTQGPTQVMRIEHRQMRGLLDQMATAAAAGDLDGVAEHGDTLLMVEQQHNVKEENVLYPMAEDHLTGDWPRLAAQLARYR